MSFRTLEITNPTEIHIKNNQLELTQENRQIYIPRFRGSTISISISIISTGVNMNHKMRLMEIRRAGYVQEQVTEN